MAITDIADFYPRIYQHRLQNSIDAAATSQRAKDVARILGKKLLPGFSDGASYGIPVGPYASRLLAECLLIDVDNAMTAENFSFTRWVDDYSVFCRSDSEAQRALRFLGSWLYDKHGLTLQTGKTKVLTTDIFIDSHLKTHEERMNERSELLQELGEISHSYDDTDLDETITISDPEIRSLFALLEEAIADEDAIEYEMVAFVLDKLSNAEIEDDDEWQTSLVDRILSNLDRLYPISDSLCKFLSSLLYSDRDRRKGSPPRFFDQYLILNRHRMTTLVCGRFGYFLLERTGTILIDFNRFLLALRAR